MSRCARRSEEDLAPAFPQTQGTSPPPSSPHRARHRRRARRRPVRDVATPRTLRHSGDQPPTPAPVLAYPPPARTRTPTLPSVLGQPRPPLPSRGPTTFGCSRLLPWHRVAAVPALCRAPSARGQGFFVNPRVGAAARACLTEPLRCLEAPTSGHSLFPLRVRSVALQPLGVIVAVAPSARALRPRHRPLRMGCILLALRLRGRSPALQSLLQSPIALAVGSATSVADTPFRADRRRVSPAVPRGSSRRFASSLCAASPCEACFRFHCVRTSKTGPGDRA